MLDGVHLLDAYLHTGKLPMRLLVCKAALLDAEINSLLAKLPSVPVVFLDDGLFAELSELKTPTGLLAVIELPEPKLDMENYKFSVFLENVQDPGNVGSILRTAAAAGCDAVFLSKACADAWSPKVLRAAMGGHFALSIFENCDLVEMISKYGGQVYAAALHATKSLYDCKMSASVGFAFGNEGAGLSSELLEACDVQFTIPMPGRVESLNVAAASAICLFEAVRQQQAAAMMRM